MPPAPPGQHPPTIHHPVGAGHARPATLRRRLLLVCIVGRGLDPSAGRRGRRPLQGQPGSFIVVANVRGGQRVARQLAAATLFPGFCKANGHGRAMLAPTSVFRQSAIFWLYPVVYALA